MCLLLSCWTLDKKVDATAHVFVYLIWSYSQQLVNLAQRLETAGLELPKSNKIPIPAPLQLTN